MDRQHDVRAGSATEVVVAAQVVRVILEPLAAVVGLLEPVALDERAHRAVQDDDPLAQQVRRAGRARVDRVNGDADADALAARSRRSGWIGGGARDTAPCSRTGSVPEVVDRSDRARCARGVSRGPYRGASRPLSSSSRTTRARSPRYGSSSSSIRASSPRGSPASAQATRLGRWKSPTLTASGSPSARTADLGRRPRPDPRERREPRVRLGRAAGPRRPRTTPRARRPAG